PNGINATDPQGKQLNWFVTVGMRYRRVGAAAWSPLQVTFWRSFKPSRQGINVSVVRGQYEVQTQKATGDGVPTFTRDQIIWTALRSIKLAPPITFPKPLALIALRIKASDQASGIINTFNCVTTSLVKAFNGVAWVDNRASQNPADL